MHPSRRKTDSVNHSFAESAIQFYQSLASKKLPPIPKSIHSLNPYADGITIYTSFFKTFFNDSSPRLFLWGINPGRFGAGQTSIPFTDPFVLANSLLIPHSLSHQREVSSEFIYSVIDAFGGAQEFYRKCYITSTCPIGFTKDGKNFNFYDNPRLQKALASFITSAISSQMSWGLSRSHAVVLGTGKLKSYWETLNEKHRFFQTLHFVEHPRFIMQYKRKAQPHYIDKYLTSISLALSS